MKKILLLLLISSSITPLFAQEETENTYFNANDSINKWTIEISTGLSKGISPYAPGFYQSNPWFQTLICKSLPLKRSEAENPRSCHQHQFYLFQVQSIHHFHRDRG